MKLRFGCQDHDRTPTLEERMCPICGEKIEVFVVHGRVIEDSRCTCGYVIEEGGSKDHIPLNSFGL